MKTFVVTVTYGDRFALVERLVKRLLDIHVHGIVIVDNGSVSNSKAALARLANSYPTQLHLLPGETNLGSAGGFRKGLQYTEGLAECEYIWLLDDDNLPEVDAFEALKITWGKIAVRCCLLSLRKDRIYRKIKSDVDVLRKFRCKNSFVDYSLRNWFRKKWLYLYPKKQKDIVKIPYAPYGGMFFPKNLLREIGYPLEALFLYMDDHEFSMRITEKKIPIFLVRSSRVADMESSWHAVKKYKFAHRFRVLIEGDPNKLYLLLRNSMYLERLYFISSPTEYRLNKWLFQTFFGLVCRMTGRPDAIETFRRAEADSYNIR